MDVEVAIVGGGPAGCASALALRALGHSVAVVAAPSCKEKPTETATPQLNQLLQCLGADAALDACEPCFGISSDWGRSSPAMRPSITNPFGHPWFIHRGRFDFLLQQITRQKGATWIDSRVGSVNFDAQCVSLVTTGERVCARWLVLATGSPSWPARITTQKQLVLDSLVAFWTHLPNLLEARLLFVEATDCGWWYVAPDDGRGIIACFVTDGQSARALCPAQACNWNELFRSTRICRQFGLEASASFINVASTGLTTLPRKFGPRWVAVGDSAVRLDPIGSSGTATALNSGQRVANAVSSALRGDLAGLDQYERWSSGLLEEFVKQREQHYATEGVRRYGDFWSRRLNEAA
jgi:2-polyprenyl-6-methoxyphenol hydroxylase-like FAD-dependent oxidoreductase